MGAFSILLILIALAKNLYCDSVDVSLVFQLQEFFHSDLILVAKNGHNDDKLVKTFLKYRDFENRGFIGVIDVQKNFGKFAEKKFLSSYQNTLVIGETQTNFIEKLVDVQNLSLMATLIWIYFTEDTFPNLDGLYLPFNSRFYIIRKIDVLCYEIEDVYQISENSEKIFTPFAVWRNGELKLCQNDSYGRRMNLMGHRFNVAEFNYLESKENVEILWKFFSEKMNFSINWRRRREGQLLPNGTTIGAYKDIIQREIDGNPCYNLYLKERIDLFDYIFPAWILQTKFFLKFDRKFDWASYLAPFHVLVYLSICIWIIVSSVIMHLIIRLKNDGTYEASFFIVIRALFWQSGTLRSSNVPLYISYLMPYLLTVILTQCYLGTLSSYLAVKHANVPFKNLQGIINDGSYKIAVYKLSTIYLYFKTDPGPEATAIRNKNLLVESDDAPMDTVSGFTSICENRWLFLNYITSVAIKEKCEIAEVEQPYFVYSTGILVWKGFPYKNVMTKMMKRLQFGGLVPLKQKFTRIKYEGSRDTFSMELVYPIFLLYLAIMILSLLILLCELLWKRNW